MLTQRQVRSGIEAAVVGAEFKLHLGRGWFTSEDGLVKFVNGNDANGYYRALGLSPDATTEEIRSAYRRLIKILHPDRGGDEELFRFIVDIASVLLDEEAKVEYDSVRRGSIYLGNMEREELNRRKGFNKAAEEAIAEGKTERWACLTDSGFPPDKDTDLWIELCRQVSPAVGYRGRVRVGVIEGGQHWPCDPAIPWGIFSVRPGSSFVVFQRGVEPNRLFALCAMIDWQKQLQYGRAAAQDRERTKWL